MPREGLFLNIITTTSGRRFESRAFFMPGDWGKGLSRPLPRAVHLLVPTCGKAVQEEREREREKEREVGDKRAKISGQSFYYPGREPIVFILDTRLETINAWARLLAPILTIISHAGLTVLNLSHAVKKLTRDCRMWLACASIVEHGPGGARRTTRANREGE